MWGISLKALDYFFYYYFNYPSIMVTVSKNHMCLRWGTDFGLDS